MIFILFEGTNDVIVYTIDERNTCKLLGGFHVRLIRKHYCYLVIQIRSKSPKREDQTNFPIMVSFGIAYTIFVCVCSECLNDVARSAAIHAQHDSVCA